MLDALPYFLLIAAFLAREYTSYKEKQQMMTERSELLNRIKPETAILSNLEIPEMVDYARTDEDYWQVHEKELKKSGTYPFGQEEEIKGR